MQTTFDKVISFASSARQGIASTFQSKVEIKAETPIMGIPVWTLFVGVGAYILWNNQRHNEHVADNVEKTRQIQELRAILSEIVRDEKDALRRENEILKDKLKALEK